MNVRIAARVAGRRLAAATACVAVGLLATAASSPAATFTSFSPPLTGASDFATGFPLGPTGLGPAGIIADGSNVFVSNAFGDGQLYKFPASGGSASSAQKSNVGFFGIALSHGVYYGVAIDHLRSFDPSTLALGPLNILLPCTGRDITSDPLSTDLYATTNCGIYRIQNPTSATPIVTLFAGTTSQDFDGLEWTGNGQHLWTSNISASHVEEYSRTGVLETSVFWPNGPDGIATAPPNSTEGGVNVSNNVFVNNNDGTIIRIDTNNGNARSTVASGGSRGDLTTVGPDGCWYVTQSDRVEKVAPCFFEPRATGGSAGGGGGPPPPPPPKFPASGAFGVGDRSAKVGASVNWWGAQWSKRNSLSDGGAPPAFKGFADQTSGKSPACGGTFTTRPGNSSKPPATVPTEMGVIVPSHVRKSGSAITGDIEHVVVVKTDAGYGPNPGHEGTGKVTRVVC